MLAFYIQYTKHCTSTLTKVSNNACKILWSAPQILCWSWSCTPLFSNIPHTPWKSKVKPRLILEEPMPVASIQVLKYRGYNHQETKTNSNIYHTGYFEIIYLLIFFFSNYTQRNSNTKFTVKQIIFHNNLVNHQINFIGLEYRIYAHYLSPRTESILKYQIVFWYM